MRSVVQILLLEKEMSWIEVNMPLNDAAEEASNVKSLVSRSHSKPMKPKPWNIP